MRSKMSMIVLILAATVVTAFAYSLNKRTDGPAVAVHDLFTNDFRSESVSREQTWPRGISPDWFDTGQRMVQQVSDSALTEYLVRLVDFRTRFTCTDSNLASGQWIYDKFIEFGFTDVSFDTFSLSETMYPCEVNRNIVAVKPGIVYPDRYIIICGHYDSITYLSECDPDTLAPGADDNGSGAVATLEAARVLANENTDRTLIFIAFGAEEAFIQQDLWMIGSEHYAQQAFNTGMDIMVVLNMDVVSYLPSGPLDVRLDEGSAEDAYTDIMADIALTYTDLIPHLGVGFGSDEISFFNRGYSSIFIGEWIYSPHWHSCADTLGHVNFDYLTEVTEMIATSTLYLANMPEVPSGLEAINIGDGTSLQVSWDPNTEPDIAGYNIYFGTQPGVLDSLHAVTSASDTLFNLAQGSTCYLAVSAFDQENYESILTDEMSVVLSSVPFAPTGFMSTSLETSVFLEWDSDQGSLDLDGYNLYRWTVGDNQDTTMLAFLPEETASYSDVSVEPHTLYGYYVKAVDTQNPPLESVPSSIVYARLATHDMGILVADGTIDGNGNPFSPTDEDVDSFYSAILGEYTPVTMWDLADSNVVGRSIMDWDTGIYAVVLWHSDIRRISGTYSDTTTMRKYLQGGGNLWLSGWKLLTSLTGESQNYFVFEEGDFFSEYMGIDSALTTPGYPTDLIGAESRLAGFPSMMVDPQKVAPIGGLFDTEILLPPFSGAITLYTYLSSDSTNSEYHGLPIGTASTSEDYGLIINDFPLYFMDQTIASLMVDAAMEFFGNPLSVVPDETADVPRAHALSQNYPNPFNPTTTITFDISGTAGTKQQVYLTIYDLRGRQVKKLLNAKLEPGSHHVVWNGRNDRGELVPSGIYFYTLKSEGTTFTRKMTVLK